MTRELLQQALDALEALQGGCTDSNDGTVEAITVWCPELIDALRAALAAPQPEPVALCDALRWSGAKESHGAMMFSPEQLRKFYEFASAPPAAPAPAVPTISPLALRALRMADMALASWENGYAFDSHGPGREAQRLVTDALALSAAPAVREQEPVACLIRYRGCTPARIAHDKKTHWHDWSEWEVATLKHGQAVTHPARNPTEDSEWQMKPLYIHPVPAPAVPLTKSRTGGVYLAGPMTGYENFNFPAFNAAAEMLRSEGLRVVNPADHGVVPDATWEDYLRYDIAKLAGCESIALLPGWSKSKGARLEFHISQALGMPIRFLDGAESATPVVREPLTEEWIAQFFMQLPLPYDEVESIVRHVEQAHGIGGGGK